MFKKKRSYIILIIGLGLLLCSKYLIGYYFGDDTVFHYWNIFDMKGLFPSNISTIVGKGFGYGTRIFYPDLPHLITHYLYLFIKFIPNVTVYTCMGVVNTSVLIFSGLSMYKLSNRILKNNDLALLSSTIYMTSTYHIVDIFARDAYNESFVFLALPLILIGFYGLIDGNYKKFIIYAVLGFALGINAHLLTMFYFIIFMIPFIIIYRKDIFVKEKRKYIILSIALVFGMCLPFLVNIIQHRFLGNYVIFDTNSVSNFDMLIDNSMGIDDYLIYGKSKVWINTIVIIMLIVSFIKRKEVIKDIKWFKASVTTLCISIYASTLLMPWGVIPKFFWSIQFPWRFSIMIVLLVSLLAPFMFKLKMKSVLKKKMLVGSIIILVTISLIQIYGYGFKIVKKVSVNDALGAFSEYLPSKTLKNYEYYRSRSSAIISNTDVTIDVISNDTPYLKFKVSNISAYTTLELPRLYYLGYELTNGNKEIDLYECDTGFICTNISENGEYVLNYRGTILYNISRVIRGLAVLGFVYIVIRSNKHEKRV